MQFLNTLFEIDVIPSERTISFNPSQSANALSAITLTVFGSVNSFKFLQPANAYGPIFLTPSKTLLVRHPTTNVSMPA